MPNEGRAVFWSRNTQGNVQGNETGGEMQRNRGAGDRLSVSHEASAALLDNKILYTTLAAAPAVGAGLLGGFKCVD
jgi:hypothetical protein